ncbi:MAG: hypothetical protein KF832_20870 [Caldilineaceae bacterium]|nr:hypothetical protein [Caldilineaceae bacterium]
MITLLILATIGAIAGGLGGALTNGLDGFVLGSCAGFVLGVVAWVMDNMAEQRVQTANAESLLPEFQPQVPPTYEQPAVYPAQSNERIHSS